MLSLARSRLKLPHKPRLCCAITDMSDRDVRAHFKRVLPKDDRISKKPRSSKVDSSSLRLSILGNGAPGGATAIVVSSIDSRYLFNCGEGTQKLCMEYKIKLPKISNLFLTSAAWKNIGGIPGFLLTAQTLGVPDIGLHGPKISLKLLECAERFVRVDELDICHHGEFFEDQVLRVQRVKLESSSPTAADEESRNEVFAYVCRGYDKPGKLILEECVARGVPPGPLFSKLKSGVMITLENGEIVRPSEVLEEHRPGSVFIVLECPSEDYVDSLLASKAIAAHQNLPGNDKDYLAASVVHITSSAVYSSEKYQKFVGLFPESTCHLHLCDSNNSEISRASIERMIHLNQIHDEIFPLLPVPENVTLPPMTAVDLVNKIVHTDRKHKVDKEEIVEKIQQSVNFVETRDKLKKRLEMASCLDEREYPKVTFLGTGSALPTKDRNVAGILVRPDEKSAFLLDCGESTTNQLIIAFGHDKALEILKQLKFVFISHMHADHHLGLPGLLLRRQALGVTDKLRVLGPSFIPKWLGDFSKFFEALDCTFNDCKEFAQDDALSSEVLSELAVNKIKTCHVDHVPESHGIRVDMNGYSLVYSGDTLPSASLVTLGKNCDLLIHEATMEDDLLSDARLKGHSTTSQAREIGWRMEAKFTLLTHFSQRYAKLPLIDEKIFADGNVGMAFDFMHVCPRNLHVLPHLYPMLKCVYSSHYEDLQGRKQKYLDRSLLRNQQLYVKI